MLPIDRKQSSKQIKFQHLFLKLTELPPWTSYFLSVVVVLVTTLLLFQLQHLDATVDHLKHGPSFIAFYFVAIAIATLAGGIYAGLLAVFCSVVCTIYFLMLPAGIAFDQTMTNYVTLAIVVVVGTLITIGMEGLRSNTRLLIDNTNLLETVRARADREEVLNKIGQTVRTAGNPEQVQVVSVSLLGETLSADGAYFIRLAANKDFCIVGHFWRKDGAAEKNMVFPIAGLQPALKMLTETRKSIVFEDCRTDSLLGAFGQSIEELGVRSGIVVPIFTDDQLESALAVFMFDDPRSWDGSEIHLVEAVAAHSKGAVDAVRLQQKEHNIAMQLQAALQPSLSLTVPGMDISSYYRPALDEANVGGDFYDGFTLSNGKSILLVGDVSGKGLAAASQVAAIRNMFRCLAQTVDDLDTAVEMLNTVLVKQKLLSPFSTMLVMLFDPVSSTMEYVSCGHEPALLYRHGQQNPVQLLESTGPVLGVFENADRQADERLFNSDRIKLEPGDMLLLYTDGVCDAVSSNRTLLGIAGISRFVQDYFGRVSKPGGDGAGRSKGVIDYCMAETERYSGGVLRDDICLLSVYVKRTLSTVEVLPHQTLSKQL